MPSFPAALVVIPERPVKPGADSYRPALDSEVTEKLSEVTRMISIGTPIGGVIEEILTSISVLFNVSNIVLEVTADELKSVLQLATYGFPREKAETLAAALSSEFYPKDLQKKLISDEFKVSRNGYFIRAEEWIKLTRKEPSIDHPAYYRNPERALEQRKSPDQFISSDFYRFAIRGVSDELLAMLDVGYSFDEKLLKNEQVEAIGLFADIAGLAIESERRKLRAITAPMKATQKTMLLEDVLNIASSIVSERDLRKLSDMILASVSSLFGFGKVSLVVYDETEGAFVWMALLGYSEEVASDTRSRHIPTEVILEDLHESRRIGKSAYLTPAEEITPHQMAHYVQPRVKEAIAPREANEWNPYDCLAFSLHDSTGRIVGVIYPSDPKDNKLPEEDTIETIEILTSLAEIAIENARLSTEREQALRSISQRTEQLSRILDLTSSIMYVRDLDQMLDDLLKTLARLMGIKRMVIGTKQEDSGIYKIEAVYGYSAKAAEAIKAIHYSAPHIDAAQDPESVMSEGSSVKFRKKLGRMTYYVPVEGQRIPPTKEEMAFFPEPELIHLPRKGKGHWHELDWMDTFISDRSGRPIAFLEILKPRDDRIPDSETIEVIEIFASLAGIAIENARMFQEHIDSRRDAELYTDVLSHDIKNFNQAILGYLDLLKLKIDTPEALSLLGKIAEQVMNTNWLASNVRTMSKVTFGETDLARTDIGSVLLQCENSLAQYYPNRKITFKNKIDGQSFYTMADDLIWELFTNLLTNAVKYDLHDPLEIEVVVEKAFRDNLRYWRVSIGDHGRGIPDEVKAVIFDRFTKAPRRKGEGMGLHIVSTLTRRYGGRVWVEDRVAGDFTKGAVFKIDLPAAD
jgi:signal transduction histidine kinase